MAKGRVDPDDDDALPLSENELEAIALRATVDAAAMKSAIEDVLEDSV